MDVKAKKHLGQHFLKDEGIAKDIADALTESGYENILEIGPGMGVLTKYLLEKKSKTTVMELDRESVAYLHDTFPNEHIKLNTSKEKFEIIEGDFLKYDLKSLFNKKQTAIIGNFPYNISTQIVCAEAGPEEPCGCCCCCGPTADEPPLSLEPVEATDGGDDVDSVPILRLR